MPGGPDIRIVIIAEAMPTQANQPLADEVLFGRLEKGGRVEVDVAGRRIRIDPPDGLLELNEK